MDIKPYLDSTYLKTAQQAQLSESDNALVAKQCVQEAVNERFKLVMLRPEMVAMARSVILSQESKVLVGTVIDFPNGTGTLHDKLEQAKQALQDGADELDFVINYEAFKRGDISLVKQEVLEATRFVLSYQKTIKWIIEIAALKNHQIVQLSALIKNVVLANFKENQYESVYVKSSTGFYPTQNGLPNGATISGIKLMIENAFPLPVKAAGGVKTYQEAIEMVQLGVKRIGTSAAKAIVNGAVAENDY